VPVRAARPACVPAKIPDRRERFEMTEVRTPPHIPPAATRRRFMALLAGAGAGVAGTTLAACGGLGSSKKDSKVSAPALVRVKDATGDAGVLNYLLTVEHVESAFYEQVMDTDLIRGRHREMFQRFGEHERLHVEALTKAVRRRDATPATAPKPKFTLEDPDEVVDLAARLEDIGASAYLGATSEFKDRKGLAGVLAIHSVEARHAAALNRLAGNDPSPHGYLARPASRETVLAALQSYVLAT
jgi:hypothetical protein